MRGLEVGIVAEMRSMARLIVLTMLLINPIRHAGASGEEAEVVMVGESDGGGGGGEVGGGGEGDMRDMREGDKAIRGGEGRLAVVVRSSLPKHLCRRVLANMEVSE